MSSNANSNRGNALRSSLERLQPKLALIFGSYIRNPVEARDIDILVISDFFENMLLQDRRQLLPEKYDDKKLDAQCYTVFEFQAIFSRENPLIRQIISKNIPLIGAIDEFI